jgi:hypothetical protein
LAVSLSIAMLTKKRNKIIQTQNAR